MLLAIEINCSNRMIVGHVKRKIIVVIFLFDVEHFVLFIIYSLENNFLFYTLKNQMPRTKALKIPTANAEVKEEEKVIENEVVENEASDEDDIQLKPKQRKPYVLTEARKAQFEKAREIRMARVNEKRKDEEDKKTEFNNRKLQLEELRQIKQKKKEAEELKMMEAELSRDESDEEVIIMKKQKKRKTIAPTREVIAPVPAPAKVLDRRMMYC
jgi:hypothetical protein